MTLEIVAVVFVLVVIFLVFRGKAAPSGSSKAVPAIDLQPTSPRSVPSPTADSALALLASCARKRSNGGLKALVQARVADHTPGSWYFDLSPDGCQLVPGEASDAAITITANSHTWQDLASKRLSFAGAAMSG